MFNLKIGEAADISVSEDDKDKIEVVADDEGEVIGFVSDADEDTVVVVAVVDPDLVESDVESVDDENVHWIKVECSSFKCQEEGSKTIDICLFIDTPNENALTPPPSKMMLFKTGIKAAWKPHKIVDRVISSGASAATS